eukprot:jgi/Hompol1/2958/HPOL_006249-RA
MSLNELLMAYQAIVHGAGRLSETPQEYWPHIANAIANLYESAYEYLNKRDLSSNKGRTYLDFAARHFDGLVSADTKASLGSGATTPMLSKRQSITTSLFNKVFAAPISKSMGRTCFLFKWSGNVVFVVRSMQEPLEFFAVELLAADGRPLDTIRVRSAFVQASLAEVAQFPNGMSSRVINGRATGSATASLGQLEE